VPWSTHTNPTPKPNHHTYTHTHTHTHTLVFLMRNNKSGQTLLLHFRMFETPPAPPPAHTHTHTHTLVVRRDSSTGPMTDNERAARSLRQVLLKPGNGRCSDCAADSEFIA